MSHLRGVQEMYLPSHQFCHAGPHCKARCLGGSLNHEQCTTQTHTCWNSSLCISESKHLNCCIHIGMAPNELSSRQRLSFCRRKGQWSHAFIIRAVHNSLSLDKAGHHLCMAVACCQVQRGAASLQQLVEGESLMGANPRRASHLFVAVSSLSGKRSSQPTNQQQITRATSRQTSGIHRAVFALKRHCKGGLAARVGHLLCGIAICAILKQGLCYLQVAIASRIMKRSPSILQQS